MKPTPTPEQALRILEILEQWTARGWTYKPALREGEVVVTFTHPGEMSREERHRRMRRGEYPMRLVNYAKGSNHLDALAQATTVMQVLLEEYPETPS